MSNCYHCNLPVPQGVDLQVEVLGETREMCCLGCQAVAQSICENGLTDYYKFRTESAEQAVGADEDILKQLQYLDFPDIQQDFVSQSGENSEIVLSIEGITCSACSWLIEKQLMKLPGIQRVNVNSSNHRAVIIWDEAHLKLSEIIRQIQAIGYKAFPFQSDNQESLHKSQLKGMLVRIGLSGLMTMQVMMFAFSLYFGFVDGIDQKTQTFFHWVSLVLTAPVVTYCSTPFFSSAWRALKNRSLNMDVSVSIAVVVIFAASAYATVVDSGKVYFESVSMFIFLLLVGRYLELKARAKATAVSANMLKLLPLVATVEASEQTRVIPAKHLSVNDIFIVQPGDTIAADGKITDGHSAVNQSMLSGESEAVDKTINDTVYAGSINVTSPIKVRVTKPQTENLVNTIIRLQDEANTHKPKVAAIADSVAKWFVLGVISIACLSALFWYPESPQKSLEIFVAILVATCPCALSLATPVALTCAISRLNSLGILIRKANVLQTLTQITRFAFDKTGTLTQGEVTISKVNNYQQQVDQQAALSLAASLEKHSEHPIALAFKQFPTHPVEQLLNHPGKGVSGTVDGRQYFLGKWDFVKQSDNQQRLAGDVFLAIEEQEQKQIVAGFNLSDMLREESEALISELGKNYPCHILSGDNQHKVAQVAEQLNIQDYYFELTPKDKLRIIEEWKSTGEKVVMVGDGINDVPVLAAANVSFAVSEASDLSKQGADVILLNQDISAIVQTQTMAFQSQVIIKQNFAWAIGYNSLALPLAFFGVLAPWMAVIGMSASSILVLTNSLRLNRITL